jgi:signal transduction histidine kinase
VVERLAEEIRRAAESGEPVHLRSGGAVTLVMPISTSVAAPGVLVIDGAAGWPRTIEMEAELLGALARQVGLALDRAAAMSERHQLVLAKDRDRIARDLHDLVIQRLFATGLQLQGARGARVEELRHRVDEAVQELDVAITDLRATIFELGRGASRSLREEVRALVSEYAAVLGFLPLLRLVGPVDRALAPAALDQLLLTLREALSNIARHAAASRATVELLATPAWFILRVTDDGGGIDLEALEGPSGLGNARHRAEELGGRLSVGPAPTGGTRLEWVVPVLA